MPHLQSIVIVLLRPILVNVTAIVTQQQNQMAGMANRANNPGVNGHGSQRGMDMGGQGQGEQDGEPTPEEIDATRTREITSKAMTAILLLLLKWLRLSREYYRLSIASSTAQLTGLGLRCSQV